MHRSRREWKYDSVVGWRWENDGRNIKHVSGEDKLEQNHEYRSEIRDELLGRDQALGNHVHLKDSLEHDTHKHGMDTHDQDSLHRGMGIRNRIREHSLDQNHDMGHSHQGMEHQVVHNDVDNRDHGRRPLQLRRQSVLNSNEIPDLEDDLLSAITLGVEVIPFSFRTNLR